MKERRKEKREAVERKEMRQQEEGRYKPNPGELRCNARFKRQIKDVGRDRLPRRPSDQKKSTRSASEGSARAAEGRQEAWHATRGHPDLLNSTVSCSHCSLNNPC